MPGVCFRFGWDEYNHEYNQRSPILNFEILGVSAFSLQEVRLLADALLQGRKLQTSPRSVAILEFPKHLKNKAFDGFI